MLFGASWRVWAIVVGAALAFALGLSLYIARQAWDARGRLEAAERAAEIAAASEKSEALRASVAAEAIDLADVTRRLERAIDAAAQAGVQEIDHAAQSDDADALYGAWRNARDGVWRAEGFTADPAAGDTGARGAAPAVRGADAAGPV